MDVILLARNIFHLLWSFIYYKFETLCRLKKFQNLKNISKARASAVCTNMTTLRRKIFFLEIDINHKNIEIKITYLSQTTILGA